MVTAALLDPVAPLPSRERSMCFLFVSVPSTLTGMSVGRTFRAGCCMSDQCPRTDWQKILSPFKISTSIIRFLLQDKAGFLSLILTTVFSIWGHCSMHCLSFVQFCACSVLGVMRETK